MSQRPPVKNLDALSDVIITSPADNQALLYKIASSGWVNATVPNSALSLLSDVVLTTPADGQLLRYDGASSKWIDYGPLAFTDLTGNIAVSQINSGSGASSTTFHRGDGTWASAVTADPGSAGNIMTSDGSNWESAPPVGPTSVLTTLSASPWTVPTGCRALYVECYGAGGQGGGAPTCSSQASCGSGGGAGAYSASYITVPAASYVFSIGSPGTGAAAGLAGNAGGDTSFGSSLVLAKGGGGGGILAAGTSVTNSPQGSGGSTAGAFGDLKLNGGYGPAGWRGSATLAMSGQGASGMWGSGASGIIGVPAGSAGVNTANSVIGAGGGGAATTGTAAAGGNGAFGLIRIWIFY